MNFDILITDTALLADPAGVGIRSPSFLAIRDGKILSSGPMEECADLKEKSRKIINGQGMLAMPGLINGHCHAAMTLFRGLADDLNLTSWLNEHIFPAEAAHVGPEMVYWCSLLAAAEMLLSGTTCVADGYFYEFEAARAFADAGLRAIPAQGIVDFPAPGVPDPADNLQAAARFLDAWIDHSSRIRPALFAHSPYTCSAETLRGAKQLAREREIPFFIHVAETENELAMIGSPLADSPVRHLDALDILDEQTVCVHCVWTDDRDLDILAARNTKSIICAQSNLKLASGMADLPGMQKRGIRTGLGTDGAASNNALDMFREMDICAKVQKLHALDPMAVPARDILTMGTAGRALPGLPPGTGSLNPGSPADLILIDLEQPHLQPFYTPDLLVYAANGSDVQHVIVDGRLVMENRRLQTFDLQETMERVRAMAENLG